MLSHISDTECVSDTLTYALQQTDVRVKCSWTSEWFHLVVEISLFIHGFIDLLRTLLDRSLEIREL